MTELTPEWQRQFLVDANMKASKIPERFKEKRIDNFEACCSARKVLVESANSFVESYRTGSNGLLFEGEYGCGKTHLAVGILQGIIEKGHSGLFYNTPDMFALIRSTYDKDSKETESGMLELLLRPDVLVLDDLGAERATGWLTERLYLVINRLYSHNRTVIITTNLSIDELTAQIGGRTASRLCEMCTWIKDFPREDYRKG